MAAAEKTVAEQFLRYGLRAGEREEDAAGRICEMARRTEPLVALQGVAQHLVFGEMHEDDQAICRRCP